MFLKNKPFYNSNDIIVPQNTTAIKFLLAIYFCIQIVLPIRHWFIKDDVLRTEEGHRLSWRMMLRSKTGIINFSVIDKATGKATIINHQKMLSEKQARMIATKPDVIWQFTQHLKNKYESEGKDVEIYVVNSRISINGGAFKPFINPDVDLTTINWSTFRHSDWILDPPKERHTIEQEFKR